MGQLYSRVFLKILDSSIADDWQVRHVFEDMLKVCEDGVLDITREAFSRRINVPIEIVNRAIEILENPDQASRNSDDDGRRIVRLDEHRNWGWKIVNWDKYDAIRSRADCAIRQHRFRNAPIQPEFRLNPGPGIGQERTEAEAAPTPAPGVSRSITKHNKAALCSIDQVEQVYQAYPRKVAKAYAMKCIVKAIAKHGFEHILERTKAYAKARQFEDQNYTPYPSTWFNQERFNDDPATWVLSQSKQSDAVQKVLQSKELERVEAKIKQIKDSGGQDAMGLILTDSDRAELKKLKARRQELIQALGMSA